MSHKTSDVLLRRVIDIPSPPVSIALPGGKAIVIRPLNSADHARLAGLFARMSEKSRQQRFFAPKPTLSNRELRFFTDVDHVRHEALGAIDQNTGALIGVARYVQYGDQPGIADVAVEVADADHATGVGGALMGGLIDRARANGFDCLSATAKWDNRAARALARQAGFRARSSSGDEIMLAISLRTEPGGVLSG